MHCFSRCPVHWLTTLWNQNLICLLLTHSTALLVSKGGPHGLQLYGIWFSVVMFILYLETRGILLIKKNPKKQRKHTVSLPCAKTSYKFWGFPLHTGKISKHLTMTLRQSDLSLCPLLPHTAALAPCLATWPLFCASGLHTCSALETLRSTCSAVPLLLWNAHSFSAILSQLKSHLLEQDFLHHLF